MLTIIPLLIAAEILIEIASLIGEKIERRIDHDR